MVFINNSVQLAAFVSFADSFLEGCESGAATDQAARAWATRKVCNIYSWYNTSYLPEWNFTKLTWAVFTQAFIDFRHYHPAYKLGKLICQIVFWSAVMVALFTKEVGWEKQVQPAIAKYWPQLWAWFWSNVWVEEGLPNLDEILKVRETEPTCSVEEDLWFSAEQPSVHVNGFSFVEPVNQVAIAGLLPAAKEEVCEEPELVEDLWACAWPSCSLNWFSISEPVALAGLLPAGKPKYSDSLLKSLNISQLRKLAKESGLRPDKKVSAVKLRNLLKTL